jgi:hypothetical protein
MMDKPIYCPFCGVKAEIINLKAGKCFCGNCDVWYTVKHDNMED